jgi:hypothetical protein
VAEGCSPTTQYQRVSDIQEDSSATGVWRVQRKEPTPEMHAFCEVDAIAVRLNPCVVRKGSGCICVGPPERDDLPLLEREFDKAAASMVADGLDLPPWFPEPPSHAL